MWWIDRWRKSTAYTDMTLEEQGAYRNLLDEAALRGGSLPDDEKILAKSCGDVTAWPRVKTHVLLHFVLSKNRWRNRTLTGVLRESRRRAIKQKAYRDRRLGLGNGAGNVRGNGTGNDPHNKRGYPDPDPEVRTTSTSSGISDGVRARARAREAVQGSGAGVGSYPRDHLRCIPPCGRVCLPDSLFTEFVQLSGRGPELGPTYVHAWHVRILTAWGEHGSSGHLPIGDDKYTFWRARWREEHGTTKPDLWAPTVDTRSLEEQAEAVRALLARDSS